MTAAQLLKAKYDADHRMMLDVLDRVSQVMAVEAEVLCIIIAEWHAALTAQAPSHVNTVLQVHDSATHAMRTVPIETRSIRTLFSQFIATLRHPHHEIADEISMLLIAGHCAELTRESPLTDSALDYARRAWRACGLTAAQQLNEEEKWRARAAAAPVLISHRQARTADVLAVGEPCPGYWSDIEPGLWVCPCGASSPKNCINETTAFH
jgi:hypothetical protein